MGKFEKFTHKRLQAFGKPTATVTKVGNINLNLVTMEKYVKENKYAILYYDKEDSLIGIQFTNKRTPEAYKIRKYRDGKFGTVTGMAFLKYYQISHKNTQSYYVEWNEQENMIIIDLKDVPLPKKKTKVEEDEAPF